MTPEQLLAEINLRVRTREPWQRPLQGPVVESLIAVLAERFDALEDRIRDLETEVRQLRRDVRA